MSVTPSMLVRPLLLVAGTLIGQSLSAQAAFVTAVHMAVPHDVRMVVEGLGERVSKHGMRFHELAVRTTALFESSCVPVVCSPETDARPFNFQRNFLLDACFSNACPATMPARLRVRLEKANDSRQVLCVFDLSWTIINHREGGFVQYHTPKANLFAPDVECNMSVRALQFRRAGGSAVNFDALDPLQFSVFPRRFAPPGGGAAGQ